MPSASWDRASGYVVSLAETPPLAPRAARGELGFNKVVKALKTLRALNLVVVKQRPGASDLVELHPMVRQFVKQNFPHNERTNVLNRIISVYLRWIGSHRSELVSIVPLTTLQYWTQAAELDIAAGKYDDAFSILNEVADQFAASSYTREFSRVSRVLFAAVDWVSEHSKYRSFEKVFRGHVRNLSNLGEDTEVDRLLDLYAGTVPDIDARYINYCDLRCTSKWNRGEFRAAVEWGKRGSTLKESSNVDTRHGISHSLALAERDAGRPEVALEFFLYGEPLDKVIDPEEVDEERAGHFYGNIGRCLQFMGEIDPALICFQKSALILERALSAESVMNQGYARAWIGELLAARGQSKLALVFLRAAYLKWEQVAPPKAKKIAALARQIEVRSEKLSSSDLEVERVVRDWIMGHNLDKQFL